MVEEDLDEEYRDDSLLEETTTQEIVEKEILSERGKKRDDLTLSLIKFHSSGVFTNRALKKF